MSTCPINVLDPDIYAQGMPYDRLAELRALGPVLRSEDPITGVPYWVITRRAELDVVERDTALFSSAARSAMPMESDQDMVDNVHTQMLINMDEPRHMQMRNVIRSAFSPQAVKNYLPFLEVRAREIVDAVMAKGQCEFVREVASELPLLAICYLLDVPEADRAQVFEWTNTMMFIDDPDASEGVEAAQMAAGQLMGYAMQMKQNLTEAQAHTVTGALANGSIDGEPIKDDEFAWMFLMVITAGNETTRSAISQGMRLLIEHPEQLKWLQENPDQIENATMEMLRYNTPVVSMRRTALKDVELGGQQIKSGDKLVLHYPLVNHDETIFGEDATTFDITRAQRQKGLSRDLRSFGNGPHYCLGTHLAKQEMVILFRELLPRMADPRFDGPVRYMRSYFVNSIKEMQLSFDAR